MERLGLEEGRGQAGSGSMTSPLRKHLFPITHFLLNMQLLSLNITFPNPSTTHGNSPGVRDYVMS